MALVSEETFPKYMYSRSYNISFSVVFTEISQVAVLLYHFIMKISKLREVVRLPKDTQRGSDRAGIRVGSGWKGRAHLTSQTHGLPGNLSDPSGLTQSGSDKADTRSGLRLPCPVLLPPTQYYSLESQWAEGRHEGPD